MKHAFPFVVLFLCATGLLGNHEINDAVEELESIPEPEEKMVGEWLGFVINRDMPVLLTRNRYVFLSSGTWEILDEAADAKPEPQGWYKINVDDRKLLLQPHEASVKGESAGIHADLPDENTFVIADPLEEHGSLTFIKKSSLQFPSKDTLAGKWKIIQADPESGEKKEAPFVLILKKDGAYAVEQPGKRLPDEWAHGSFEVAGLRILLHNDFTGTGLWQSPSFFLRDGKLRYNDRKYCVWCERISGTVENGKGKQQEQDSSKKTKESGKD